MMAIPIRAALYELAIESADPRRLATFYSLAMGYEFHERGSGLLGTARERRLHILPGKARQLGYAAYAVQAQEDLEALRARLERAQVPAEQVDLPGLLPGEHGHPI